MAKSKGKRYTEEQILRILNEVETGTPVAEVCRQHQVAEVTVYRWRKRYGGMEAEQVRRLKQLEIENGRLKRIVADQALDIAMLKDVLGKQGARHLMEQWDASERRASAVMGLSRSSLRYRAHPRADEPGTVAAVRECAERHPVYGYRRVTAILRREGRLINPKQVHRIWQQEGLQLSRRATAKRRYGEAQPVRQRAEYRNHVWSYDFLEVRTERGQKVRILAVIDEFTRECLALLAARSFPACEVLDVLSWLFLTRGVPEHLRSDNGPEFIAQAVKGWLAERHCQTLFITPGSPWENPFIESFNGSLREECLNRLVFGSLREVQLTLDTWREEYNHYRPHSSLGYLSPAEFAQQAHHPPAAAVPILSLDLVHI